MRLRAATLVLVLSACSARPDVAGKWFAIAAARPQVSEAVALARELRQTASNTEVIQSGDCAGFRPGLFLVVVESTSGKSGADRTVTELRNRFKDAYSRECKPGAGSAVALGVPIVDKSIFQVPKDSVNWDNTDMVSAVHSRGDATVLVRRWYDPVENDPLEGRRVSVVLKSDKLQSKELISRCSGAEVVFGSGRVAVTCQKMVAGSDMLHAVSVFDLGTGKLLETVDRCRNPKFESGTKMVCERESGAPR